MLGIGLLTVFTKPSGVLMVFCVFVIAGSMIILVSAFRWYVYVDLGGVSIQKGLKMEKYYKFSEITKVHVKGTAGGLLPEKSISLYAGNTKILTVLSGYIGYRELRDKLEECGIIFQNW